ncbi:MAG: iron export ABC transporter permease subunit FetB [Candidatus Competibacterales bacterium]
MNVIPLEVTDLALAASLLLINAGLSLALALGLERPLMIAALRMVVQLWLVGLILEHLFALTTPGWTALVALAMVGFAGLEIMNRQQRRLKGLWGLALGTATMAIAAVAMTLLALTVFLTPDPWYTPRYAIPLFGMILGNSMTGIGLGLNSLTTAAVREKAAIEAQLALGASRWQALRPVGQEALRSGSMPIVNSMATTGLVFLPGMMTGQILAGVEPTLAVKYQLLIMFLIAGATGMGVLLAVVGGAWRLTDSRHRLRLERLRDPR